MLICSFILGIYVHVIVSFNIHDLICTEIYEGRSEVEGGWLWVERSEDKSNSLHSISV